MAYNNYGLMAHAKKALAEEWKYVYATYGQVITQAIIDNSARKYPTMFNKVQSDGRTYKEVTEDHALDPEDPKRGCDCLGLFKSYLWWRGDNMNPLYNSAQDTNADGMFSRAKQMGKKYGPISTIPSDVEGILVRCVGHVGIYDGAGSVIEAIGANINYVAGVPYRGVVKTPLKGSRSKPWTDWYYAPYVEYADEKPVKPTRELKLGDSGADVSWVQKQLMTIGYDIGTTVLTGKYGTAVQAAVLDFQKKYGILATGTVNARTADMLEAWQYVKPTMAYARGANGPQVRWIQLKLIALKYNLGEWGADGSFGATTESVIKTFQKDYKLQINGVADLKTIAMLEKPVKPPVFVNPYPMPTSTLRLGDVGESVKWIQYILRKEGLFGGIIGGNYGPITEGAVRKFQARERIEIDGIAGPITRTYLSKYNN